LLKLNYQEALDYIASLAPRGWRLGLDRMEEFVRRAGLTESLGDGSSPKFIHVAGTNGKGSTTAMLQSCLAEICPFSGSFFSPYVVDPRERVQFGREMISEGELTSITDYLKPIGESLSETEFGGVTEFEFKTAIGFEYWKRKQCDWVALEVGLGGRLDATNVVTPAVSVIVSIGYDHVNILGNTLKEIAFEKAGILKPGVPGVIGQMDDEARSAIEEYANKIGAPLWRVGYEIQYDKVDAGVRITTPRSELELMPSLFGDIQLHNAALVYAALELAGLATDKQKIRKGVSTAYIPGRFSVIGHEGREVIFDGAHNAESAQVLAKMLTQAGKKDMICVTGMLTGHEPQHFYEALKPFVKHFHVAPVDFPRTRSAGELAHELRVMGCNAFTNENATAALKAAMASSVDNDILVTGSFYLVGEIMRLVLPKSGA
jgi:dihydrofolate synthase / folylpolyglutamate synthase